MKSVLIIGVGRFGIYLAKRMQELGNDVMVVDSVESKINDIAPFVARAQIGDCMDEKVLKSIGVNNFDICFVTVSHNFQASLEITSNLKELNAKQIIAKADKESHEKFLIKVGADSVIHVERETAYKVARKYSANNIFDYFELTDDFSIVEIQVPPSWVNKTIKELDVRLKYRVNIIAIKHEELMTPIVSADYIFCEDDHIVISGYTKDCNKMLDYKSKYKKTK